MADPVRTNIVLDDELVERARKLTGLRSKRAVVDEALRTLVRLKEQAAIRELRGKLHWEGDLRAMRSDRRRRTRTSSLRRFDGKNEGKAGGALRTEQRIAPKPGAAEPGRCIAHE